MAATGCGRANRLPANRSTRTIRSGIANDMSNRPSLVPPLCGLVRNRSMMEENFLLNISYRQDLRKCRNK